MTANDIVQELQTLGSESTKRTLQKHGAPEPLFGVKVSDLKPLVKRIKKNHELSLALYDTGISDAMYLAGLIADEKKITKQDLHHWAERATWSMLSESTVAWIAAESQHGWELALQWIDSDRENIASSGWSTLSSWVMIHPDEQLDLPALSALLERITTTLPQAPNRVRYTMNGFIMSCGISVKPLTDLAIATAQRVGQVQVNVGNTACKVPDAAAYIRNAHAKGHGGLKKKMARC